MMQILKFGDFFFVLTQTHFKSKVIDVGSECSLLMAVLLVNQNNASYLCDLLSIDIGYDYSPALALSVHV